MLFLSSEFLHPPGEARCPGCGKRRQFESTDTSTCARYGTLLSHYRGVWEHGFTYDQNYCCKCANIIHACEQCKLKAMKSQ